MKVFLIAALSILSASVMAESNVSTITCLIPEVISGTTTDVKVEFLVQDLGSDQPTLLQHPQADEYGAILVTPERVGERFTTMTNLNAQGGDLRSAPDRIRLFGDGDGYTFVDLVLFKSAKYKKGYVRVSGFGEQSYQKITCSVK